MIEGAYSFTEYTNGFLPTQMDIVDAPFSDGSILQSQTSGRDSSGGVAFAPCHEATGGEYSLCIGKQYTMQQTRIVQMYVAQGAAQSVLGGRLVSFCEAAEDIQGETVQVAINILPDNTLQATRANAQGTGFILRNIDQGGDSQMTLLGTSSATITSTTYLEIQVFHHATVGSITVWIDNATTPMWELTNVNTAISGNNSSQRVRWGGYASIGIADDTYHHEDLNATISNVFVINATVNPDDANDPIARIGDHKPLLSLPIADDVFAEYTPDPVQAHFLNVNEVPPDDDTTENETAETEQRDNFEMDDVTGTGTNQVYLAYTGYVKADTGTGCGVSDALAQFQSFVYMRQPEAGTCLTTDGDASICNFTDGPTRRAETVCTISQDGEAVRFKPNLANQDGMFAYLTPLSAPPRVLNATGPDRYSSAVWNQLLSVEDWYTPGPILAVAGQVEYTAPWNQPWQGTAIDPQDEFDTINDFMEFQLLHNGIGVDVTWIDSNGSNLYNPYTSPFGGFHFRGDGRHPSGDPYFWIGTSFAFPGAGTTLYTYDPEDKFTMKRVMGNIEFYQNFTLLETFPVTYPTHTCHAVLMGQYGFNPDTNLYDLPPGLRNVFVSIGGLDCVQGNYLQTSCTINGTFTGCQLPEALYWGVLLSPPFNPGDLPAGDATVMDRNGPNNPLAPVFGYDPDTELEFSLVGGNVRLTVTDWVNYADNMTTVVGNIATWDYTEPYASTDDFALILPASGYAVGNVVIFPFPNLEYAFHNASANAPLRLAIMCSGDSDYALPDHAGVKETSFTFIEGVSPATFQGFMRDSGVNKDGTEAEVSTSTFRYDQSFLATAPDDTTITLDEANSATHGYTDPE